MANNISLSQEEQTSVINVYQEVIQEICNYTGNLVGELTNLCNEVKFKPLTNHTNEIIWFYGNELPTIVKQHFSKWRDSAASLHSAVDKFEAGDDARTVANMLETQLEGEITQLFANSPEPLSIQDTIEGEMNEDQYEKMKDHLKKYIDDLSNLYDDKKAEIESKKDDNIIYGSISGVVLGTIQNIIEAYQQTEKGLDNVISDYTAKASEIIADAELERDNLVNSASNAAQSFSNFASMFKI